MSRLIIRTLLFSMALILVAGPPACAAVNGKESKGAQTPSTPMLAAQERAPAADQPADKSPEQVRRDELIAKHGTEVADAILAGNVLKGMTMEQVLLARGAPIRKEIIPPDAELWHYTAGEIAFGGGKVSYVALASKMEPLPTNPRNEGERQRVETRSNSGNEQSALVTVPPIKVGDSYIYESIDPDHPGSGITTKRTVTSKSDKITFSIINLNSINARTRSLYFNHEWNLIGTSNADNSGFDYSPPLKYFDFPLYPGKAWQQTTTETNVKTGATRMHKISGTVGQWEDVSVPAGVFHAIKVILQTELFDPTTAEKINGTDISWYVPEIRRSVKSLTTGKDGKKQLIQLIRYELK